MSFSTNVGRGKKTMNKTVEQIEQELDAKIPRSEVMERDDGGGRSLSYLSGYYVTDRLNKIFGPLNWDKEIVEIKEVVNTTSRGIFPAYLAKVRLTIRKDGDKSFEGTTKEAYGYGADKSGKNAHELAIKEAVTDATKVAAKDLGMSLGLALYSKEQENVEEDDNGPAPVVQSKPVESAPTPKAITVTPVEEKSPPVAEAPKADDSDKIRGVIRSHVRAAIKKGTLTLDSVKAHLQEKHGADNLDGLAEEQLKAVLEHVKGSTK